MPGEIENATVHILGQSSVNLTVKKYKNKPVIKTRQKFVSMGRISSA
jgi:hypothetical protein